MNQYNLPSLSGSESQSSIQKTFERYNQQDRTSLWFQESDQKPLDLSFQDPQPTKKNSPQQVLFNFSNEKEENIEFQPLIPLKFQEQKMDINKTILKQNNYVTPPKVQSFQPFQDSRQAETKQINEQSYDKKPKYVILETKIKTTERKKLICQAPQPNYIIIDFSKGKAKVTSQSTIQVHLSLRDLLQK